MTKTGIYILITLIYNILTYLGKNILLKVWKLYVLCNTFTKTNTRTGMENKIKIDLHTEQRESLLSVIPGNLLRLSNSSYWIPEVRGQIIVADIDNIIFLHTAQNNDKFDPVIVDDDILRDMGFYVDNVKAHIKYNDDGNIFQLNKINGSYEFTWGSTPVKYAHHLQNLFYSCTLKKLIYKNKK